MPSVSPPTTHPHPAPLPAGLIWPGQALDPASTIPQNRPEGTSVVGAPSVDLPYRSAALADPSSHTNPATVPQAVFLRVACPAAYHAPLQAVIQALGSAVTADVAEVHANADLVFFSNLAEVLAQELAQDPDGAGAAPRPIRDIVTTWQASVRAVLDAVSDRGGDGPVVMPAAVLGGNIDGVRAAIAAAFDLAEASPDVLADALLRPEFETPKVGPQFTLMAAAIAQTTPQVGTVLDRLAQVQVDVAQGNDAPGSSGLHRLRPDHSPTVMQDLLRAADALHSAEREALSRAHTADLHRVETAAETAAKRLRAQADAARAALLDREAMSNRLSEDAAQHDAAATFLKEELTRRETVYSAQSTEVTALRQSEAQLEAARKATSLKGNRLEGDVAVLTRNIQMRDARIAGLAEALHGFEDEALELRAEVAALRRSTSWRLTAPVRAISVVLRKILRRG